MGGSPGQGSLLGSEPTHYSAGHKRLERGTFQLPTVEDGAKKVAVDPAQLAMILQGIDLRASRRRRYQPRTRR